MSLSISKSLYENPDFVGQNPILLSKRISRKNEILISLCLNLSITFKNMHLCCFYFRNTDSNFDSNGYILSASVKEMVNSLLECAELETMMPRLLEYEMRITRIIPNITINRCYENGADNVLNIDINIIFDPGHGSLKDKMNAMHDEALRRIMEIFANTNIQDEFVGVESDPNKLCYVYTPDYSMVLSGKTKTVRLEAGYPRLLFKF